MDVTPGAMDKEALWKLIAAVEIVVASTVILLDLLVPTLVVLVICVVSVLARRQGASSIGFKKVDRPLRMVSIIIVLVLAYNLLLLGVVMPVLNHLTGTHQDLTVFDGLKGNIASLAFFLLASWTLAAVGEEIVYRGYLQARVRSLIIGRVGIIAGVAITSVLFGVAHLEQGIIGVVITTLDAVFFSAVKLRFDDNLWAAVLAHGLSNTIGLVTFYFVGPVYGLW